MDDQFPNFFSQEDSPQIHSRNRSAMSNPKRDQLDSPQIVRRSQETRNCEWEIQTQNDLTTLPQTENSGREFCSDRKLSSKKIEFKLDKMNSFFCTQSRSFALQNTLALADEKDNRKSSHEKPILFKSRIYKNRIKVRKLY